MPCAWESPLKNVLSWSFSMSDFSVGYHCIKKSVIINCVNVLLINIGKLSDVICSYINRFVLISKYEEVECFSGFLTKPNQTKALVLGGLSQAGLQ